MKNKRHQIKSKWYYVFWGTMAVAVVGGQIYVGSGYREMAEATRDTTIQVTCLPQYDTPNYSGRRNRAGEFE